MSARRSVRTFSVMVRWSGALAVTGFVIAGCQAIAGIEDRHYEKSDGGQVVEASKACATYCTDVMKNCFDKNLQYYDMPTCLGVCANLPEDDPTTSHEAGGNSVSCRETQALQAATEPDGYCDKAGPGGAGVCGTDCESYCNLYAAVCAKVSDSAPAANCLEGCKGLKRAPDFQAQDDFTGDTLDCRLVHVSAASLEPATHCQHARFPSAGNCVDTTPPNCVDYCKMNLAACQNNDAQYDSNAQCVKVCQQFTPGTFGEGGNTIDCRLYHSYNAVGDPDTHCSHAGPGGDGVCSTDNCQSYCDLAAAACPQQFKDRFGIDKDACHSACIGIGDGGPISGYSIKAPNGPTLQCRLLRTVRAFADSGQCDAAFGAAPCD